MYPEKTHSTLFLWSGIISLLLFLFYFPFPQHNVFWELLQDTGHLPLFGGISLLLLLIFSRTLQRPDIPQHRRYLASFVTTLLLAAFVEFAQGFIDGREESFNDFFLGAIGSLCFLLGYSLFDRSLNIATNTLRKLVILLATISLLLIGIYPLVMLSVDYLNKNQAFPTLLTFEQTWPAAFLTIRPNERLPSKASKYDTKTVSGFLPFTPNPKADWPFIRIDEVVEDWQAFSSIEFTFIAKTTVPLPVVILLDDQHNRPRGQHSQRYRHMLMPGQNHLNLPLTVKALPQSASPLDTSKMASIWIAFPKPRNSSRPAGTILIGEIRLQ